MKSLFLSVAIMAITVVMVPAHALCDEISAQKLVEGCWDYMRDKTSESVVDMTIHRQDWQRTMTIKAWTKGRSDSLFFIMAPAKDKGNGTLKKNNDMWTYNPKINRTIKLPPSMMSQSWMGSDFSNNDLAKSDSMIHDYNHTIEDIQTDEGQNVYLIKSMPKPAAPVVWGMQRIKIREDLILSEQIFFDEDLKPVKIMTAKDIQNMGGKRFPRIWKMHKTETPQEYTLLEYRSLSFDVDLSDRLFSLSSLKNPIR